MTNPDSTKSKTIFSQIPEFNENKQEKILIEKLDEIIELLSDISGQLYDQNH